MHEALKIAAAFLFGYAVLVGLMFVFQRHMMYFPSASLPSPAVVGLADMEAVRVITHDGLELTSWYKPAAPGRPTLVLFQGNAGNISHRAIKARFLLDKGYGVLLLGYRGFGGNPGHPSESGLIADGRAALDFLKSHGLPEEKVVLYGESLGTGVALQLAGNRNLAGVILESPFTSAADVAQHHYFYLPARWLLKDRFDSMAALPRLKSPLLLLHGTADRVVPQSMGRELFDAAPEPKRAVWLEGLDHNDLHADEARRAVLEFLESLARAYPAQP